MQLRNEVFVVVMTISAPSPFVHAADSGRDAVPMTVSPAYLANWVAMEPTPPAAPMIRRVFPGLAPWPEDRPKRRNKPSQAVLDVSGSAAACAKSSVTGFKPTIGSSTR